MSRAIAALVGRSWGHRVVIGATLSVYAYLFATDPGAAVESLERGLGTLIRLFTLIVASLLLASALETLLPENAVTRYLGSGSGLGHTILAGLLGGLLLGGPYASYPIMRSVRKSGAGYTASVAYR